MYNLIKQCNSGWKMTPFTAKLVSNKSCLYHDIFFATGTRVSQKNEKSVTLSVLSVLIRRSMLHFLVRGDVSMSWSSHRALTHLCQQQCLQARLSVGLSSCWHRPINSTVTFPATISSQFKLDVKERATTNEIKRLPVQTAAANLLPRESYAKANICLLALLQKLFTATLN